MSHGLRERSCLLLLFVTYCYLFVIKNNNWVEQEDKYAIFDHAGSFGEGLELPNRLICKNVQYCSDVLAILVDNTNLYQEKSCSTKAGFTLEITYIETPRNDTECVDLAVSNRNQLILIKNQLIAVQNDVN